jgi:hypothetical protein
MADAIFRHLRRDAAFAEWSAATIPPLLLTELQTAAVEREETLSRLIGEILENFAADRRLKRIQPKQGPTCPAAPRSQTQSRMISPGPSKRTGCRDGELCHSGAQQGEAHPTGLAFALEVPGVALAAIKDVGLPRSSLSSRTRSQSLMGRAPFSEGEGRQAVREQH